MSKLEQFERSVVKNIQQIWGNQGSLKAGLDAAEFHLRAYRRLLADIVNKLNDEGDIAMETLSVDNSDGTKVDKKVVDMKHYFLAAQAELVQIEQEEKAAREREKIHNMVKVLSSRPTNEVEVLIADLEAGAESIKINEKYSEPLTPETRKLVLDLLRAGLEVRESLLAAATPGVPNDGVPEGATVFGGDYAGSEEQPEEGPDCHCSGGAPCELSKDQVLSV